MNIDKIKERLAALLAKTVENGASEAEALAAMDAASRLAEKFGVSLEDLDTPDEVKTEKRSVNNVTAEKHEIDQFLAAAIARYTDTLFWTDMRGAVPAPTFFGIDSDVELAFFLRSLLKATMINDWGIYCDFVWDGIGGKIRARKSFMFGFCERMRERLDEYTRAKVEVPTGNALVVAKTALVNTEYEKLGIRLSTGRGGSIGRLNGEAAAAGRDSGSAASMGRGVGGSGIAGLLA